MLAIETATLSSVLSAATFIYLILLAIFAKKELWIRKLVIAIGIAMLMVWICVLLLALMSQ